MNSSYLYLLFNLKWMAWNLFLAFLPFLLSFLLFKKRQKPNIPWLFGLIFYILFLPNTVYVVTDIIHFFRYGLQWSPLIVFVTALQYVLFIFAGVLFFYVSYKKFEIYFHKKINLSIVRLSMFLAISVGVYLGRFLRLNSWDVFFSPLSVVQKLESVFEVQSGLFIFGFTILIYLIYYIFERVSFIAKN